MTMFDPEKITYFAKTDSRGAFIPFGIKAKDRQRHMYVVGKTGMGKSTLLENMAAQDIMNGEGMAFIDPHGSAAETLLEYIPEHRIKDVVYFAPFDLDHPVAFNIMEDVGPDKRHLVVSGLMSTFKKIWVDAWSARMEYILTNALLVLIEYPDTTLLSVNRLFSDKAYRLKVVAACTDPAVKSFWVDEFANYTERFTADALPAIQNKVGQFTGNPLIRNIIGQPHSSFDIRQMMDERKILIMNLSKGLIGETNANLLGSMLTTRIYLAAMSRADLHPSVMKTMPNFYFYVDEFQSFANATFANILSEARKYHLNLIIAHQYIAQMEEEVRDAVFGNVGTTVTFRVGPFDAEVLETVFTPTFLAADLVNLGFAQIYLTLMIDGVGSQPFSAATLPPVTQPPVSFRGMAIDASRKAFANRREDVEKIVTDLHTPEPAAPRESSPRKDGPKKPAYGGAPERTDRPPVRREETATSEGVRPPVRRETPPQKTPDDLRAILGRMSQDQSLSEKSVAQQPAEATAPVMEVKITSSESVERTTKSIVDVKVTPPPVAERKEVLRLNNQSSKSAEGQRQPSRERQGNRESNRDGNRERRPEIKKVEARTVFLKPVASTPPAQTDAKADLKSALASVLQNSSPKETAPAPAPAPVMKELSVPSEPVQPATQPSIGTERRATPQFGQSDSATLDPNVIRRMLRDEKQDRSPFA